MANWRTAKRLLTLLAEVNKLYPSRNKASDGTIGDTAHQKLPSEHNPDRNGVVRALDITIPVAPNVDGMALARRIIENRDASLWYVIVNGQIWENGRWSKYNGKDQHYGHIHISLYDKPEIYDNNGPWLLKGDTMPLKASSVDKLFKMSLLRDPAAAELNNRAYANDADLVIDTLWENGGKQAYEAAKKWRAAPLDLKVEEIKKILGE